MSGIEVEVRREHNDQQVGGDVRLRTRRGWVRFAIYYGSPPGSRIGYWRTRAGDVRGVNFRVGRRYVGPCLTFLLHTRSPRGRL